MVAWTVYQQLIKVRPNWGCWEEMTTVPSPCRVRCPSQPKTAFTSPNIPAAEWFWVKMFRTSEGGWSCLQAHSSEPHQSQPDSKEGHKQWSWPPWVECRGCTKPSTTEELSACVSPSSSWGNKTWPILDNYFIHPKGSYKQKQLSRHPDVSFSEQQFQTENTEYLRLNGGHSDLPHTPQPRLPQEPKQWKELLKIFGWLRMMPFTRI